MAHLDFVGNRRKRCNVAFKRETGALLFFTSDAVRLYKGGWAPTMMFKTAESGGWCFGRGAGHLELRSAIARARRIEAIRAGRRPPPTIVGRPYREYADACFSRFVATVPEPIRAAVMPYHRRSWQLYAMLARCGDPAFELEASNPGLAFVIANCWVFAPRRVRWEMRRVRSLLWNRRPRALGRLGFPATKSVARVLARVARCALDLSALLHLRGGLHDSGALARLRHVRRINRGVIRLLTEPPLAARVGDRLVAEVSRDAAYDRDGGSIAGLVRDTDGMISQDGRDPPIWGSLAQLHDAHLRELERVFRSAPRPVNLAFPPPPLPDIPRKIEALRHSDALVAEGRSMRNCLASGFHAHHVTQGRIYVYRVLEPERCSLAIARTGSGGWRVDELKGPENRPAGRAARDLVWSWLRQNAADVEERDEGRQLHLPCSFA